MEKEITLDFLIKYLTDDIKLQVVSHGTKDTFNLDVLENINSKNFKKFNKLFEHYIDRIGVTKYNKKKNISLIWSILHCIDEDFCVQPQDEQYAIINVLHRKMKDSRIYKIFKKNLTKTILYSRLNAKDIQNIDLLIYAIYFKVNIFMFNFENEDINCFYEEEKFNRYKMNIFISNKNDSYHPLIYKNDNGRHFKYNSSILEKIIISKQVKSFNLKDKEFTICNNWESLLEEYKKIDLNNIIVNLNIKTILDDIMIDSDESNEELNSLSISESDSDDLNLEIDNLTEEIQNIETMKNVNIVSETDTNIVFKLKKMSKNKLKKHKKHKLIEYIELLTNKKDSNLKLKSKDKLIVEIQNIISSNI